MELSIPLETASECADIIKETRGLDIDLCYQCQKCTSGCPVSYAMDSTPTQLLHAVQLGLTELALNSKAIWLCTSCQTCTTRCPQGVDLASIMDELRIIAQHQKIKVKLPEVPIFYRCSLTNIRFFGRMYELGLVVILKLFTRSFTKDVGLGLKMLAKGKLNVLPSFGGALAARRIFSQVKGWEKK